LRKDHTDNKGQAKRRHWTTEFEFFFTSSSWFNKCPRLAGFAYTPPLRVFFFETLIEFDPLPNGERITLSV
jgi:hypothetical protein